jgi:peptidoglycan/LPS O-acetylase OafA/YrhL
VSPRGSRWGLRSGRQYLKERATRLLVPTAFASVVLLPPMVYVWFLSQPNPPPFWEFYLRFFTPNLADLTGRSGGFTPAHLWFALYLFTCSVIALPVLTYLRRESGQRWIARLAALSEKPGAIFLWAIPLALTGLLPDLDGKNPFFYLLVFVYGYVLVSDARFQPMVDRHRVVALLLAAISTPLVLWLWPIVASLPRFSAGDVLFFLQRIFNTWFWLIAILGFGHVYLNVNSRVLRYLNEAAYPFYILHLPVNTFVGYFVVQWNVGVAAKYLVINVFTILATLAAYDVLVRRTAVTRFLFGMRPRQP